MDEAVEMAKGCPVELSGASISIFEVKQRPEDSSSGQLTVRMDRTDRQGRRLRIP